VGLKIAPIAQLAPAARSFPLHVSLLIANWPDTVAELIWSATELGLVSVVVIDVLVAPTTTLPNDKFSGLMVSLPAIPVPLSAAEPALAFAVSVIASDALRLPSAPGVNVSVTIQLLPGARVEPHPLLEIAKSPELAPMIWKLRPVTAGPAEGLVIWILFAALVAPVFAKTTLPNATLVEESDNPTDAAAGAAAAIAPSRTANASAKKVGLGVPVQPLPA
jgi:hypothetical protein